MKVPALLLISLLLLFSAFFEDSEGLSASFPPGKRRVRELEVKVCIPGITFKGPSLNYRLTHLSLRGALSIVVDRAPPKRVHLQAPTEYF